MHTPHSARSTWATLAVALAVGVIAFFLRVATFEISNDDYLHLTSAQQVLLGDVPVRDFIDPGEPLFYYVSAATQQILGRNVLSEVLLDVTGMSIAYVLAILLATRVAGSRIAALVAVALAILLVPRLYAYPKLLLYTVNLWLIWRYADAPRLSRLWAVAIGTAVAFLFRHDHGAYIGVAMGVMLVLVHAQQGWHTLVRRLATFGAATTLLLLPFLLFLQLNGGVVSYFRNTLETARGEYERTVGDYPQFRLALAAPRIRVQWTPNLDDSTRDTLARTYSLSAPYDRGDDEWEYDVNDRSRQNLGALVADARVAATDGFDPEHFNLLRPIAEPNVLAWFYYLTFAVAPLALVITGLDIWRRVPRALVPDDRLLITTAALSIVMNLYLMRSASESAVGDVSAITAVVAAWLIARGFRRGAGTQSVTPRALKIAVTLIVIAVSGFFASRGNGGFAATRVIDMLAQEGWTAVDIKLNVGKRLAPPFDNDVSRYVYACTARTDRLLVTGYQPEIYYGSGRGFAAGRPYFLTSFAPSAASIAFSLNRLRRERVPIVLVDSTYDADFAGPYPTFDQYIRQYYREVGSVGPADRAIKVFTDQRITPITTYYNTGLPCFR